MILVIILGLLGGIILGFALVDYAEGPYQTRISQKKADAFATLFGGLEKEERKKLDDKYNKRTSGDRSIHCEL
jgi:hypothetical protein